MNENLNYLEQIRINEGNDKCKKVFYDLYSEDRKKAVELINDNSLTFTTFFILLPAIQSPFFYNNLNYRNLTAMGIVEQIIMPQRMRYSKNYLFQKDERIQKILKWILETAKSADFENNSYEKILDTAVSVLLNVYEDKSIHLDVVEMIFRRSKDGKFFDDLVWALFKMKDIEALKLIAERILSQDKKENSLACNLLSIEDKNCFENKQKIYASFNNWIKDNDPFLYFTGEIYQLKSNPVFYSVDFERRYLYKTDQSAAVTEDENRCLDTFKALNNEDKDILSAFSLKLHNKNLTEWNKWIKRPVDEQLKTAKAVREDSN